MSEYFNFIVFLSLCLCGHSHMKRRPRRSGASAIFLAPPPIPSLPPAPLAAAFAESAVALVLAPVDSWKSSAQLACSFAADVAVNNQTSRILLPSLGRAENILRFAPSLPQLKFRPYRGALVSVAGAAVESLAFVAVYRFLRRFFTSVLPRRQPTAVPLSHLKHPLPNSRPFEILSTRHIPEKQPPLWTASVLAGAGASVFSILMSAPIDLIRERIRSGQYISPLSTFRAALAGPKSWKGLYVGVIPTIVRDLPFDALEFAVFEAFQRGLCSARRRRAASQSCGTASKSISQPQLSNASPPKNFAPSSLSSLDHLALGMLTGAVVGAAVAPLDLVVTRILVNPSRYSGLLASLRTIVREEGCRGLFAGAVQKVAREAFASGLFFTCYEGVLSKFGIVDDDHDE